MGISVDELLNKPFSTRTHTDKLKIVEEGKPLPVLPNLVSKHQDKKSEYTRHFSCLQYETVEWLTGCEKRGRLFCWPCLLFLKDSSVWNKHGFSDLNHLSIAQRKHEKSQSHIQSFLNLKMFGNQRIDPLIDNEHNIEVIRHNEQVKRNRDILKRIIDVICYLVKQELSVRGHDVIGNYIEFLNVLRNYDSLLDNHLSVSTEFQGTSLSVKNDIIKAISNVVKDSIRKEICAATFVAIILGETSDVMSKPQLSMVLRFVHEGRIHERFVGFADVSEKRTSEGIFNLVVNIVKEFQIEDKLVGQTYDGACVMSDHVNNLQSQVLDAFPLAIFTHCYTHVLNFVLQQSLSSIKECGFFFKTLNGMAVYFSPKRVHALQEFLAEKLASVAPTRWNFTSRLSNTVKKYRRQLMEFFYYIIENSEEWDTDAVVKARGFLGFLQDFQTILFLEIFSKLLGYTATLFNVLQSKAYDVPYCCKKINEITEQLKYEKDHGFEEIWASAIFERDEVDEPRPKRIKIELDDNEKNVYLNLFYKIIDSIYIQIETRYASLSKLEFFHLLCHEKYEQYNENFPDCLLNKLKDFYGPVFDYIRLKNELKVIYSSSEFSDKDVLELVKFMRVKKLKCGFKEVFKLSELILTIPSNTAEVEHSFSALKQINISYRGTLTQRKLCSLSLLSIEKSLLMELKKSSSFYDDVIEQFLLQKRRMELMYK